LQRTAQLIDNECSERFAFDIFGNDQQRRPILAICSKTGSRSFIVLIFFS
jgi:hypothetical protein